jgi:hypothetical protein
LTVNMKYDGHQDEIATAFCEWPRNDRIEMREFKRGAAPLRKTPLPSPLMGEGQGEGENKIIRRKSCPTHYTPKPSKVCWTAASI